MRLRLIKSVIPTVDPTTSKQRRIPSTPQCSPTRLMHSRLHLGRPVTRITVTFKIQKTLQTSYFEIFNNHVRKVTKSHRCNTKPRICPLPQRIRRFVTKVCSINIYIKAVLDWYTTYWSVNVGRHHHNGSAHCGRSYSQVDEPRTAVHDWCVCSTRLCLASHFTVSQETLDACASHG
jgi:hypothetical protein